MSKIAKVLIVITVIMTAVVSCKSNDDNLQELKVNDQRDLYTESDIEGEGGSGGNNPPPGGG